MRQQLLVPALVAGTLILGSWFLSNTIRDQAPQIPARPEAPDFTLKNALSDEDIKLSSYRGKVVLLDFWATWCRPCLMEIPHFKELRDEFGADKFEIIGVSTDHKGLAVLVPFLNSWKLNYPVGLDTGTISTAYGGIRSLPTTFLLDKNGRVIQTFIGYKDKRVFHEAISKALAES
jgi:peroxiredoxin